MTPLGHAAVTYLGWRPFQARSASEVPAWMVLVAGLAPDIDFLLLPFEAFNSLHRVVTHNVFFVAVVAALLALSAPRSPRRAFVLTAAAGLLHLLVDSVMDNNASNGLGVALLWPAWDGFFQPFNLVPLSDNPLGWRAPWRQLTTLLPQALIEAPFIAAALLLERKRRHRAHAHRSSK